MKAHTFDSILVTANLWIAEIAKDLSLHEVEDHRAMTALRAGLHAIRDRLPLHEVTDLGAQLPTLIRGIYYEGFGRHHDPTTIRDREAMLARVRREIGPTTELTPERALGAVIGVLIRHVSDGEIRDMVATFPRPIAELWHELSPIGMATRHGHRIEHTGYRR